MKVKVEFLSSLFCLITLSTTESYMREQQLSITTAMAFGVIDIVLQLYTIFLSLALVELCFFCFTEFNHFPLHYTNFMFSF